jgi:hypothetical protein
LDSEREAVVPNNGEKKQKKLRDKGVVIGDLPDAHADVIEGLTDDEVDIIVSVKERLDAADKLQAHQPGGPTQWVSFIRF